MKWITHFRRWSFSEKTEAYETRFSKEKLKTEKNNKLFLIEIVHEKIIGKLTTKEKTMSFLKGEKRRFQDIFETSFQKQNDNFSKTQNECWYKKIKKSNIKKREKSEKKKNMEQRKKKDDAKRKQQEIKHRRREG